LVDITCFVRAKPVIMWYHMFHE